MYVFTILKVYFVTMILMIVKSKSFMENLGHEGLNKMLDGFEDRTAEAVCTFAFCRGPGEEPIIFQGRTEVRQILSLQNLYKSNCDDRVLLCDPEAQDSSVSEQSKLGFAENQNLIYDRLGRYLRI